MTARFVIVAEDELGQRLARDLTDRIVAERARAAWLRELWSDEEVRSSQRSHRGLEPGLPWSTWEDVKRLSRRLGIRVHGRGMQGERAMAHKAVAIVTELVPSATDGAPITALFLVHDTDGDPGVEVRLREGARGPEDAPPDFAVVVAVAHPESEAWVIAGATARSPDEHDSHRGERARLGFNPVTHPERLTANRATDKRDAKRVCETLLGPHGVAYAAWERCWQQTPLDVLDQNGARAGLSDFTREIAEKILPLLDDER